MADKKPPASSLPAYDSDTGQGSVIQPDAGSVKPSDNASEAPVFRPGRSFYLAMGSLMVVILAVSIDATSLSVALPVISSELGGTALEAFWSGTSFLLASTVLQPTVAGLSSIFGRKYLLYITGALFFVGSLIGAVAQNFTIILIGRTIQGIGGGGLIALSEMVVTDLVPLAQRGKYFSLISAMWSVGTVTGPLIGAGFAQDVTWRWIFWFNLPAIGLGMAAVVFFLHQQGIPGGMGQKIRRFDWLGSFLFTVASTSFLFGLTTGGVMYDWDSWRCLLPMIMGVFLLIGFGYYELNYATDPIVNKGLFSNWAMTANYIISAFHGIILWSLLYFLVLYYQAVKNYSTVISAVAVLPETLTVAPAGMIVGVTASMLGRYRWALWSGWVITTVGCGLLLLLEPDTTVTQFIFLNLPVGIGTGMLFPAMNLAILAACEPSLNGQAAAFFSFSRTFGQAVGVAVSGVIFQNGFKRELEKVPAFAAVAGEYARDATAAVGVIKGMPEGPERTALVAAYNEGLKYIWYALLAFAAVSMVIAFTVKEYTLNQEHVTNQGLKERGNEAEKTNGDQEK